MADNDRSLITLEKTETDHGFIEHLRHTIHQQGRRFPRQPRKLDQPPSLYHGWLLPYLLEADRFTWRRWEYWALCMEAGRLIDRPLCNLNHNLQKTRYASC